MNVIERFKSLPSNARRSLSLGMLFALLVALPLFVWVIISNQKFLFKQKAQEINGIGQKDIKVMVIDFDPILTTHNNQKLSVFENWNSSQDLEASYSSEIKNLSNSYANYQIVERNVIDGFPKKNDGFTYTESSYLACLNNHSTCHNPDLVDYLKILDDYHVCDKVNSGEIDELWIWGGPWFGYYEAEMTGPNPFDTNAPPLLGSTCNKDLHIMGFNYERGLSEMIEDFGHRFEGTMTHVFTANGNSLWTNYTNHSACGSVHIPPNGISDYDWTNTNQVSSSCEDYLNYPALTYQVQTFGCEKWGCTGLGWKEYWLNHIPKATSYTNGSWDNWWKYVFDYQATIAPTPTPTATATATATATSSASPAPLCDNSCTSNSSCPSGLICYSASGATTGNCRNPSCTSNSDCVCLTSTPSSTPTPTATATSAAKRGDINLDGVVNSIDIGILIDNYMKSPIANNKADINNDGAVNSIDLGIIIDNYGK